METTVYQSNISIIHNSLDLLISKIVNNNNNNNNNNRGGKFDNLTKKVKKTGITIWLDEIQCDILPKTMIKEDNKGNEK